jgi:SAM-dependent methyltransferase
MESEDVKLFFNHPATVDEYTRAVHRVGLWDSERIVFMQLFKQEDIMLDLGCGAGRIAFGLKSLGFNNLMGIDPAENMIANAEAINQAQQQGIAFEVGDATALRFEEHTFDGVIFGFNGLMQIPKRARRQKAMEEIFRVLKPGGAFVFTSHDRDMHQRAKYWREERRAWDAGVQQSCLDDFGDIAYETTGGTLFIHAPTCEEIGSDLDKAGFELEGTFLRSQIACEKPHVREFADECRFWIARKLV